jgi:hypothetical protein
MSRYARDSQIRPAAPDLTETTVRIPVSDTQGTFHDGIGARFDDGSARLSLVPNFDSQTAPGLENFNPLE